MTGDTRWSGRWVAAGLQVGRAAAFLTLATGVNGTMEALVPNYEPIYVYLLAVVIVAWLTTALLGVATAIAAVVLYDWMFSPVQIGPSMSAIVPLSVAIAAALITRLAHAPLTRPQLPRPATTQLLAPAPMPDVLTPELSAAEADRIGELERKLVLARANLEREARMREEATAAIRQRSAALEQELDAARTETTEHARAVTALRAEVDDAVRAAQRAEERAVTAERDLSTARLRVTELEQHAEAMTQELELARQKADEERARSEREVAMREEFTAAANQLHEKALADLAAKYQGPLAEAKRSLEDAFTRIPILEHELEEARRSADEQKSRAAKEAMLRADVEKSARTAIERALSEASARHQQELAELRTERDRVRAQLGEQSARTEREALRREEAGLAAQEAQRRAAEDSAAAHRREVGEALMRLQASEARVAGMRSEIDKLRVAVNEERQRAEREMNLRQEAERTAQQARERTLAETSAEHQTALTEALMRLKGAEARAAGLEDELERLRKEVSEERQRAERESRLREQLEIAGNEKLQAAVTDISGRYEDALADSRQSFESARERIETLQSELAQARQATEDAISRGELQRAQRELEATDFDEKLRRVVTGITTDYENSLGEALVEKETARAEAREAKGKLQDLHKRVAEIETLLAQANQRAEEMRGRADEEKAARERLDVDWNAKLQKIVTHLASDHEVDLGEAMVQKEAAKAEARNFSMRLTALQKKLEQERDNFRRFQEKWEIERAQLLGQPRPVPQQSREGGGAVILVVHSDSGIRAMSKHVLEQSGYVVLTAADGLEGLRVAASQKPAVVLAEAVMPKMNGRELVQLLKSRRETAGVKIVLMSGPAGTESEHTTDFRADDFLRNPADFNTMRATLAQILAKGSVAS